MGRERSWSDALRRLSALLYEADPEGMGASVFAPPDEYVDMAERVLRTFIRRPAGTRPAEAVLDLIPSAWPELIAEIVGVCEEYERARMQRMDE